MKKETSEIRSISTKLDQGYHETKKHTGSLFPYNVYLCTIPDDFPSVFLHWQDTMELIYIKKGAGMAQVDRSVFEIHAGDILLVPPGHLHGLEQLQGQHMEYENIIFGMEFPGGNLVDICSLKYLLPLTNGLVSFPLCITRQDPHYKEFAACLDDADELCDKRYPGYELGVKADMIRLFSLLFRYTEQSTKVPETDQDLERLKSVLHFIEDHYQSPVKVQDAARYCGYSESHFMRWFRQMTGTSFLNYLNRYRLERAYKECKNSKKTVLEISEETGFDNLSNFNRQFKKRFGITPRELRR